MRHWRARRFIIHTLLPVLTADLPKLQLLAWIINKKRLKGPRAVKDVTFTRLTTSLSLNNAAQCAEWGMGPNFCISLSPSLYLPHRGSCGACWNIYESCSPVAGLLGGVCGSPLYSCRAIIVLGIRAAGINSQQHLNWEMQFCVCLCVCVFSAHCHQMAKK